MAALDVPGRGFVSGAILGRFMIFCVFAQSIFVVF